VKLGSHRKKVVLGTSIFSGGNQNFGNVFLNRTHEDVAGFGWW